MGAGPGLIDEEIPLLEVNSRHFVQRIEPEAFGLSCPDLADVLVGGEPAQGLEPWRSCRQRGIHRGGRAADRRCHSNSV